MMMYFIGLLIATGLGAFMYRARGAGWNWWPIERPWNQVLMCLPLIPVLYVIAVTQGIALASLASAGLFLLFVSSVIFAGMGHGDYMRLTRQAEGHPVQDKEEVGIILKLFFPNLTIAGSRWAYEFVGLSLTGLVVTLAPAILLFINGFVAAACMMFIAGVLKGAAYEIGWRLGDQGTEHGEWLFGGFLWGFIYLSFILI